MRTLVSVSRPSSVRGMAAFFDSGAGKTGNLTDDIISRLLENEDLSELEDIDDDDLDFNPNDIFSQMEIEDPILGESHDEILNHRSPLLARNPPPAMPPSYLLEPSIPNPMDTLSLMNPPALPNPSSHVSSRSRRGRSSQTSRNRSYEYPTSSLPPRSACAPGSGRKRQWKVTSFNDKSHDYPDLPAHPVRRPIEYFQDYFDDAFIENMSNCTNIYCLRKHGRELKTSKAEIFKLLAIHIIMGCIPSHGLPMYWRAETKLNLVTELMTRDRFLSLRENLHVVDTEFAPETEKDNPLWKVQPLINKIKDTCNKLERVPGYYSIDEQMIPFTGRCCLRQVVKNKPRPVGLKNFVLTTSEGLMLDFEIYKGARTTFGDKSLGIGPSVILHLSQSIPPGSCVYHDRYFTTVPLIEEMAKSDLHATGTIMLNRIPERATIKFKKDSQMRRGETQQFVCMPTVITKWKDNKSVLLASNCSGTENMTTVKRWNKVNKIYVDVSAPKVVQNYNKHMGGVDVLDQQMEYYRTFIKTKKWTLKVIIHFLDLALVNSWRLYSNDCKANGLQRKDIKPLLDFRMDVADSLANKPERVRRESEDELPFISPRDYKIYRPANAPSESKRYDGYEHYPNSDDIKAPRTCRLENCTSRSKIKCEKCDVYLCLARNKNCFKLYHKK